MIGVEAAISRVRRDITLGVLLKFALVVGVLLCVCFAQHSERLVGLTLIIGTWVALSITSARSSRLSMDSPLLIATGRFDEAEEQIDQAMRAFTVYGPAKLRTLQQLAMLRHAQRRWEEAARICRALLGQRFNAARSLDKPTQLILSDSLLEMNDLPGTYASITELYRQTLSLDEVLNLVSLQLDYESRIGAWAKMFETAAVKVQLAELMPSKPAARVQAFVALAARNCGRDDWADWLRRRVELLVDVEELVKERPLLGQVWDKPVS